MSGRGQRTTITKTLDKYAFRKDQQELPQTTSPPKKDNTATDKAQEITLLDVMSALQQVQISIATVSTDITLLRADVSKINTRIKEVEIKTAALTTDTATLQQQVRDLESAQKLMAAKLDDQEGRSRRNNIRLVGVPENIKGPALDLFVEDLITNQLQPRGLSKFFSVERAHQVPGGRPRPGATPRPILARLFNYKDRDLILQVARVAPPIKVENCTVAIYPDYTAAVTRQRRNFHEVKLELRKRELKYSMLYRRN